jgi:hypothetical protein
MMTDKYDGFFDQGTFSNNSRPISIADNSRLLTMKYGDNDIQSPVGEKISSDKQKYEYSGREETPVGKFRSYA